MKRLMCVLLLLMLCLLLAAGAAVAEAEEEEDIFQRVTFLLVCNEGMNNTGGNVGNTMMVVSLQPFTGDIRLLMFTWDTFIDYENYDIPQLLDQPYRQNGPEGTMRAFNANFDQDIELFLSVNYLNLANMIDDYGGVTVDITRAERNALNGMVVSKKEHIQAMADTGLLEMLLIEGLAQDYYLNDWGKDIHLNGLQAVGFGWLQYDSVYNCCLREVKVITNLFNSVGATIGNEVAFWTDETGKPQDVGSRRLINLDHMTEADEDFLYKAVLPIFEESYNNLTREDIVAISEALARAAWIAARQGYDVFKNVRYMILPLEARDPYDVVAGRKGHLVDHAANAAAITEFLYGDLPDEE